MDTVFSPQAAGAAAVVGDGNHSGEIAYRLEEAGAAATVPSDIFLQTTEKRGEAGTAAEGNDVEAAGCFGAAFFHGQIGSTKRPIILQKP